MDGGCAGADGSEVEKAGEDDSPEPSSIDARAELPPACAPDGSSSGNGALAGTEAGTGDGAGACGEAITGRRSGDDTGEAAPELALDRAPSIDSDTRPVRAAGQSDGVSGVSRQWSITLS
jgi:hypothetical protein